MTFESVYIYGAHFTSLTAVFFGSHRMSFTGGGALLSDSEITLFVGYPGPPGGWVDVRVVTQAGTSPITTADRFFWALPPVVTSVSPNSAPFAGGTTVRIYGKYFSIANGVGFTCNGCPKLTAGATYRIVSDTEIDAVVPDMGGRGTGDVYVSSRGGTNALTPAAAFTYN